MFVQDNYLPLALCSALFVGYNCPQGGLAASELHLQHHATLAIFVLSGLTLRRGEAAAALKAPGAFLFGCLSVLVLTPAAALLALRLPLHPPELALGLAVFCCMPTALSAGVSLTQAVGGNTAIALLLTVATNLLAVFTLPFTISALLGASAAARPVAPWPLLQQLLHSVLLPTLVGAGMRACVPGLAAAMDARRRWVGHASSTLLALAPWIQVSKAAAGKVWVSPLQLLLLAASALLLHLLLLVFNMFMVNALELGGSIASAPSTAAKAGPPNPSVTTAATSAGRSTAPTASCNTGSGSASTVTTTSSSSSREALGVRRAVVLVASQKTLVVAVAVLSEAGGGVGGLAVVACVLAHLGQVLVDSLLVSQWQKQDRHQQLSAA